MRLYFSSKTKDTMSLDYSSSIYFDERNLKVIDMKDPKITIGRYKRLVYIFYESRRMGTRRLGLCIVI